MSHVFHPDVASSVEACVLITFCNQRSSPLHSLCALSLSSGAVHWIDLSPLPEVYRESFAGICGVCRVGDQLVIATQGAKPVLATVDMKTATLDSYLPLEGCKDAHSVVFQDGYVYVVSTGTNEIYRAHFQGGALKDEELYWQFPGVRYDRDEIHLNGMTVDGGRLICSCFGEKTEDGSWGTNGRIIYLDTGEIIREKLKHPHTPLIAGNRLFFAESATDKVYAYEKSERGIWVLDKELQLGGYTRGLALMDGYLLVGISASRKVSRSQKTVISDPLYSPDAAVVTIDLVSYDQKSAVNLSLYGREVYDLMLLPSMLASRQSNDVVVERLREMEATIDKYEVDVSRLWNQNIKFNERVLERDKYIEGLQRSVSWRITAPLRKLEQILYWVGGILSKESRK
jgi:hypothetical protein